MVLNIIGLGIFDKNDISLKGLEAIKSSDEVYIEYYTCILHSSIEELEQLYGKPVKKLFRSDVEVKIDNEILPLAKEKNVSLLIIGDPISATTHIDLIQRCREQEIKVNIIHSSSVFTAIAQTGLQLYKFGKVTSIPFQRIEEPIITPITIYNQNKSIGAHSLFLLDLDPENDKFLSANEAMDLLISASKKANEYEDVARVDENTELIVCARLGAPDQIIRYGKLSELKKEDFAGPVHCIIIPGKLHFMEEEFLEQFK